MIKKLTTDSDNRPFVHSFPPFHVQGLFYFPLIGNGQFFVSFANNTLRTVLGEKYARKHDFFLPNTSLNCISPFHEHRLNPD